MPAAKHPSSAVVQAVGLGKTLDDRPVLKGIDLGIDAGEYVVILGVNGAGKTTLLKMLATLAPPTAGELRLFGLSLPKQASAARASLGLIGHQSMLYRDLTARENLELFARLYGVTNPRKRASELLDIVGLLDRGNDPVKVFSRGMTQRVSIARALVHEPDLLLADEPFAGLDVPGTLAIERLLTDLHRAGKTIVMVNHDIPQSLRLAERIIVLRDGMIGEDRSADSISANEVLIGMSGVDGTYFRMKELAVACERNFLTGAAQHRTSRPADRLAPGPLSLVKNANWPKKVPLLAEETGPKPPIGHFFPNSPRP